MASGEIIISKDFLDNECANFSQCQKNFKSGAYNTYESSYLCNSGNAWVNKLKAKLDDKYQKIDKGYQSIVEWWENYSCEVNSNEDTVASKSDGISVSQVIDFAALQISLSLLSYGGSSVSSNVLYRNTQLNSVDDSVKIDTSKKEEKDDTKNKKNTDKIISNVSGAVKNIATAASYIKKVNSSGSEKVYESSSTSFDSTGSTSSTSASINNSTSNADSVNKVEQSSSNATGTNNGVISDNVNNTEGEKSNVTNGTNSETSGTNINNGNITENLLKTKIEKAINDYNTTHTSDVLPPLNYNEFEDLIKEVKEIGLTDDEIAQTVIEIMRAKYY